MIKQFHAHCRPSSLVRAMRKHSGDVSEGDRPSLIARRTILGRVCRFYTSGEHTVDFEDVSEEDSHNSILLRYAHASLIINEPVGDKRVLWVDATKNPCEVWIHSMPYALFLREAKLAAAAGVISREIINDDNPIPKVKEFITDVRNV
jgi:hypothetical protein